MISSRHDHIPAIVYKWIEFQNMLKNTAEAAINIWPFSTEAFKDMQAH